MHHVVTASSQDVVLMLCVPGGKKAVHRTPPFFVGNFCLRPALRTCWYVKYGDGRMLPFLSARDTGL
jgi:hypothetical protein